MEWHTNSDHDEIIISTSELSVMLLLLKLHCYRVGWYLGSVLHDQI